jgi:predicted DNA-binding ribbon-helix-helix protein
MKLRGELPSPVVGRFVRINGHGTSISVEEPFWTYLKVIAAYQDKSLAELVSDIDRQRDHNNLSSAVRLYVLNFVKQEIEHGKVLSL